MVDQGRTTTESPSDRHEDNDAVGGVAKVDWVHQLFGQVARYLPGSIVPVVLGLVSVSVFTRIFGAEEYGQYSYSVSLVSLVGGIGGRWIQQSITRYISGEADVETLLDTKRAVLLAVFVTAMVILFLAVALSSFVSGSVPDWYLYYWPSVGSVLVSIVFGPLNTVLQAELRAGRHTTYNLVRGALHLVLALVFALWVYRHPIAIIYASIMSWVVLTPLIWRDAGLPFRIGSKSDLTRAWKVLRNMALYGVPLVGWYVCSVLLNIGDRYVIQAFQGSEQVGIYSANYGLISGTVGLITTPIILAAQPLLVGAWRNQHQAEAAHWLALIVEWLFALGTLLVALMVIFAQDISGIILGPAFREGYQVIPLSLSGIVLWQLALYFQAPVEFVKKTKILFWLGLGAVLLNFSLNILLVPSYGYLAAAYTTTATYLAYAVAVYLAGRRYLDWRLNWMRLALIALYAAILLLVVSTIRVYVQQWFSYPIALALAIVISGLMSLGFMWWVVPTDLRTRVVGVFTRPN